MPTNPSQEPRLVSLEAFRQVFYENEYAVVLNPAMDSDDLIVVTILRQIDGDWLVCGATFKSRYLHELAGLLQEADEWIVKNCVAIELPEGGVIGYRFRS